MISKSSWDTDITTKYWDTKKYMETEVQFKTDWHLNPLINCMETVPSSVSQWQYICYEKDHHHSHHDFLHDSKFFGYWFITVQSVTLCSHPNDVLAGGDGQAHHTGAVHRHDAVTNAELAAALGRTSMKEVGYDHCGQDGAPAGLHYRQTQNLSWRLGDDYLNHKNTAIKYVHWVEQLVVELNHKGQHEKTECQTVTMCIHSLIHCLMTGWFRVQPQI